MNCDPRNRRDYIEVKIRNWLELAVNGIDPHDRVRARRNYRRLLHSYPELAFSHGFTEAV